MEDSSRGTSFPLSIATTQVLDKGLQRPGTAATAEGTSGFRGAQRMRPNTQQGCSRCVNGHVLTPVTAA